MADWWRSWHGAPTDPKWLLISRRTGSPPITVAGIFWALCDYASQHSSRGTVEGFDVETYAVWAGIEEAEVDRVIDALTEKGLIAGGRLAAWEKRQPQREDDSAPRVRAFRERQAEAKRDVTQRNAGDMPLTPRNAPDTDTDTDTEKKRGDTEENKHVGRAAAPARVRERDPLFEAVIEVCYEKPASEVTDDERGRANRVLPQLRKINASPDDVRQRAGEYRSRSPEYPLTPQTLTKIWTDLGRPRAAANGQRARAAPDYSGIEDFSRQMDALEARGQRGQLRGA